MKSELFTFSLANSLLVYGNIAALRWYFVVSFKLFPVIACTSLVSLGIKIKRRKLANFFQSFYQISRVFELHSEFLSLCYVIYDWYELIGCVATDVDCHENLAFYFVVEFSSERRAESILVEE